MPADAVQWIVTGYAISFGGLLILGGRAADLLGRRRMFVIGLVAFAMASLAGGLAQDPVLLIAARVVQGAGAAIVAPAALSLITTGFPEGAERTRAIGLYGAVSSVGFVSGQVLGGVLVQLTSWRAVFLVNVPVGLIAAALSPAVLGRRAAAAKEQDPAGRPRRAADHRRGHPRRLRGVPGRGARLDLAAGHRGRRGRRRGRGRLHEGGNPAPGTAHPPVSAAPQGAAGRDHAGLPARPVERRGDAGALPVPAAGAARVAAAHRPDHRPAGRGRVRRGRDRAAAGGQDGRPAAAGADRRRGGGRLPRADPAARDRLQPGPVRGHADRLRHRGHRARLDRAGQPRHGRRRPGPGRRHDQHQPPDRRRGGRGPAAGRGRRASAAGSGSPATAPRCSPRRWPRWPPPPWPGGPRGRFRPAPLPDLWVPNGLASRPALSACAAACTEPSAAGSARPGR